MELKELIISDQNKIIQNQILELENDNEFLNIKLDKIKGVCTSNFSDSLACIFYGGKVGFMRKNGAKKLSAELEKTIDKYNNISKIESKLKTNQSIITTLRKGKICSSNKLIDWSYEKMLGIISSYEKAYETKKIKEKELTNEELIFIKEEIKIYKSKVKKVEKKYSK